ncbi:MAG: hypothetical protein HZB36_08390 [Candidatus Omnitrophica bacterium]|nr:hypothetical protein [Candidatus Omnitrophota bacterium]
MYKKLRTGLQCFLFLASFFVTTQSFADEQVTLTTYYPSPYGVYKQLKADTVQYAPQATAPANNAAGTTYYNDTDDRLYVSNGTDWLKVLVLEYVLIVPTSTANQAFPYVVPYNGGIPANVLRQDYTIPGSAGTNMYLLTTNMQGTICAWEERNIYVTVRYKKWNGVDWSAPWYKLAGDTIEDPNPIDPDVPIDCTLAMQESFEDFVNESIFILRPGTYRIQLAVRRSSSKTTRVQGRITNATMSLQKIISLGN